MIRFTELPGEGRITGEDQGPCVWCGRHTDCLQQATGLPGRPEIPLHPECAMVIIVKRKRWARGALRPGHRADQRALELFGPMPAQLGPGT